MYVIYAAPQVSLFSNGFVFWYWPFYDPDNALFKENRTTFIDLYIGHGTQDDFKSEILEYPYSDGKFSVDTYNTHLMTKVNELRKNSNEAKRLRARKPDARVLVTMASGTERL